MARHATLDADGHPTGFYSSEIHKVIPAEAVPLSEEQYLAWRDNTNGLALVAGALIEHQRPAPPRLVGPMAASALRASDGIILRCYEHQVPVPTEWVSYRKALRALADGVSTETALPPAPGIPPGI